jgi:ABC-type phosphate transport system auxiliary subunit
MNPDQIFGIIIASIVSGSAVILYAFRRFFAFREKQLHVDATLAAEKAAQYAASNAELEQRLRVVEQIVTDGGAQTAAQIEALREPPLRTSRNKIPQESLD